MPTLGKQQFQSFMQALLDAYDRDSFERMLWLGLEKKIQHLVKETDFKHQVFQVIEKSEMQGWTYKLIIAARAFNLGNEKLQIFASGIGLGAEGTPTTKTELESITQASNSFLNSAIFRLRLGWIETAVCRIKVDGCAVGTGFLVGPDVVMTNHHVVARVIGEQVVPRVVICQFDYKQLSSGQPVDQGIDCALIDSANWLIASSPPTTEELASEPKSGLPATNELDFALLRLNQAIANVKLDTGLPSIDDTVNDRPRAWLTFKTNHDFTPSTPLWIVQHPKAAPLKLALDSNAVIKRNENCTRVTYRTNTESGSSGSPVFDQNWNLVALHHMGDPDGINPTQNEGIPVDSILAYLQNKKLDDVLES